jgi:hypothetical protein
VRSADIVRSGDSSNRGGQSSHAICARKIVAPDLLSYCRSAGGPMSTADQPETALRRRRPSAFGIPRRSAALPQGPDMGREDPAGQARWPTRATRSS